MEGFVDVKDNKAVSKRKRANNEYYTKNNYNKENYAPISSNNISDNLFKETSKLAGKDGYYLSFVWQNSIPKYILPGMMTKILYLDEGKVREAEGCIVKAHHAIHSEETGITRLYFINHCTIIEFNIRCC
jgi:hypothetical protein